MDASVIVPGLFHLPFPVGHAYLWNDGGELTLIDTGIVGSGPAIAEAIRGLGLDPAGLRRVVLTHCHPDHYGAAAEIGAWAADTSVLAHRADAPVIRGEIPMSPPVLLDWELPIAAGLPALPPTPPARVDHELDDGDVLDFGGGARIVAVPGHTDGSIAVHLPLHGVLLTGDAVANVDGRTMLGVFNTDRERAISSFHRLSALEDVDTACFGHGDPLVGGAAEVLREVAAALPRP